MKFGTFLIIEACDKIGYKILVNQIDNSVTLFDKNKKEILTFTVDNTNSFSNEFYFEMNKSKQYSVTSAIHSEIKYIRNNAEIMNRWKISKFRNSNLNKIFS